MSIRYELNESMEAIPATGLASCLVPVTKREASESPSPVVAVLTPEEVEALEFIPEEGKEAFESLVSTGSNFAEVFPSFVVGSFSVPAKETPPGEPTRFSFFLSEEHLIFIEEGAMVAELLASIAESGVMGTMTTAHCLYVLIKALLMDGFSYMEDLEDEMEDIEETMVSRDEDVDTMLIMGYRRQSITLGSYFEQVSTMASIIGDNENKVMSKADARSFGRIASLGDRLVSRASTLKEYSMQLHELHQTRIDLKQNSTMQIFTIVTVLFAPLTLVTGWFGMNLQVLPGIDVPFMSGVLLALFATCTIGLLVFFRVKKWL